MKFGNIATAIHSLSASIRGGLLSGEAKYIRKDGTESTVYLVVEQVDTMLPMMVHFTEAALTVSHRIFTAVLAGQEIDFATDPPIPGDVIEMTIGNVTEKWWVADAGRGRCWGYLDGNQAIWIYANASRPK